MNGRTNSNNNTSGLEIEVPLDPVTNVSASPGNGQVELTWTDPLDKYAATEGEVAESPNPIVSQWDHTRIVRKENTQPTGPNDGVIVLSSDVRNQYQSTSYVDSGLINDTLYHYGLFACNAAGLFSTGTFGSATPKAGTPLSQLSEGTIIKILENGSPVEFYLAKHDYEPELNGSGRMLCVRKDCHSNEQWNSDQSGSYKSSVINKWLNQDYKQMFSKNVQSLIGSTTFYSGTNSSTYTASIFLLSSAELGYATDTLTNEGTLLPIANTLKTAKWQGSAVFWWQRSYGIRDNRMAGNFNQVGVGGYGYKDSAYGRRPCFTLPSTARVNTDLNLIES